MRKCRCKDGYVCLILFILTAVFCWLFVLRFGTFGAKVDWISQHSVLPDYFRQQFYETGELFPEFALNIGGGQNIYNFAYYGLYSPVILISYLLPFVKMSDYMMVAQFFCLAASVILLYLWIVRRRFPGRIAFGVSVIFLLSGPMIFHSYNQIMFVNYMPFLCMGLLGVDRYFEKGRKGLLTAGIFLMIMTSFYFSIGGMLALVLYGVSRYLENCAKRKEKLSFKGFMTEGFRFLVPFITAVLLSSVLLVPTAMALTGRGNEGFAPEISLAELMIPKIIPERFLYSPYGTGMTTLGVTALIAVLFFHKLHEKMLAWGCAAILTIPAFAWLLNGGLYIRDKVMIPFLPLLCYIMACYLRETEHEGEYIVTESIALPLSSAYGEKARSKMTAVLPYLPYLITLCLLASGSYTKDAGEYWKLMFADGVIMLICFAVLHHISGHNRVLILIIPPIVFLAIYGNVMHRTADRTVEKEFCQEVTDEDAGELIRETLEKEEGLYRTEQQGNDTENAANLNRIHDMSQLVSSVYSSSYNAEYQKFREETFELEEPFRNFLMQSAARNPVYQDFMGVKYLLLRTDEGWSVQENEDALPVAFATDRLLSEKEYKKLDFPYNQLALLEYAAVEDSSKAYIPDEQYKAESVEIELPEKISEAKNKTVRIPVPGGEAGEGKEKPVLFLQFRVKNLKPSTDLTIWVEGVRNKLTSRNHFYYNDNTIFTYAVPLEENQREIEVTFGEGKYEISDIKCFLAELKEQGENGLCQSELKVNKEKTKGNTIAGEIDVKNDGYFVTTIPYDKNFEILVDGKNVEPEKVNTAFLGFKIKEGRHKIEINYHAPGAAAGKFLSLLGFLLVFI